MGDVGALQSSIDKMQATQPDIAMGAVAYHYETRTRIVYYTDAYGNTCSRTESYQEKVITATIVEPFAFKYWRDCSQKQVEGLAERGVTKVNLECLIVPGDDQTKQAFEQAYENFRQTHQYRDVYVDFEVPSSCQTDGFIKDLERSLLPGGTVLFNKLVYNHKAGEEAKVLLAKFNKLKGTTKIIKVKENIVNRIIVYEDRRPKTEQRTTNNEQRTIDSK